MMTTNTNKRLIAMVSIMAALIFTTFSLVYDQDRVSIEHTHDVSSYIFVVPISILLVLLLLGLFYVLRTVYVRYMNMSELDDMLFKLRYRGTLHMFFPREITVAGKHYAASVNGIDGYKKVDGFISTFVPVLNIYSQCLTLSTNNIKCCSRYLNAHIKVTRVDDDYVRVDVIELFNSSSFWPPTLSFVKDDTAVLGFMDNDVAWVRVQASPFVGCYLTLEQYEELRIRTGKVVNFGYLEFATKGMGLSKDKITRIGLALRQEMRVIELEPHWSLPRVTSAMEGGNGDILVHVLDDELDVNLDAAKPVGKLIPSMYTEESVVFPVSASTEKKTFTERIEKYVKRQRAVVPVVYNSYVNEFLQLLVEEPYKHSGCPDDEQFTLDRMTRPVQRKKYDDVKDVHNMIFADPDKSFQKGEIYDEIKAPRNIINPGSGKGVPTGAMVHALTAYLKVTMKNVYGFGTADYLQECFEKVEHQDDEDLGKFETDGTKMDANISSFFRDLELKLCLRFFRSEYHEHIKVLCQAQYHDACPKSKKGNRVNLFWSRRSGEGGTSTFNTIAMTFVFYCWLRSNDLPPQLAYKKLGIYGGDDGLTVAYYSKESLLAVADDLGLPLKVKHIPSLKPFSFLGVIKIPYMPVYAPDVVRFSSKISYSHVKGVPAEQILMRKCEPLSRLWSNIPLVSNLSNAVLRILAAKNVKVFARYDELCRSHTGFVVNMLGNSHLPSPMTDDQYELVELWVCESLNIPLQRLREVCERYDNATSFDEFPAGFLSKSNMLLVTPYETLVGDVYIPSPGTTKLVDPLPIETQSAIKNLPRNAKKEKEYKTDETTSIISSSSEDISPPEKKTKTRK